MKQRSGNSMAVSQFGLLVCIALSHLAGGSIVAADDPPPVPVPLSPTSGVADAIEAHMVYLTEHALDEYGSDHTPRWLATIDIRTSRLPEQFLSRNEADKANESPRASSNLYLDQPSIVAAYELARRTGCKCYSDAASAYTVACLRVSETQTGKEFAMRPFRHYDVIRDETYALLNKSHRSIHTPAWETVWMESPEAAERAIRTMAAELIEAEQDNPSPSNLAQHARVLDSIGWLASKTNDPQKDLLSLARDVVKRASTSDASIDEFGAWVESLLRASRYTGEPTFQETAETILSHWQMQTADSHELPPSEASDAKDSPTLAGVITRHMTSGSQQSMPLAEACLSLWESTGDEVYRQAATRCAEAIRDRLPMNTERAAVAEDFGRSIHFLIRASEVLDQRQWRDLAGEIADDAMERLYEPRLGMFRSRQHEDRCDAIDGPGFLLLALLYLDGPDPTAKSALHF